MNKRIYQIDLLKIIAFFLVVMVHHNIFIIGDSLDFPYLYIIKSCVPIFMICTGFTLFIKEREIKTIFKNLLKRIILPAIAVLIIGILLSIYQKHLSLENLLITIKQYLGMWQIHNISNYTFYLWYVLALIGIYVAYPVLSLFCKDSLKENKIRHYVMIFTFLSSFLFPTFEIITRKNIFPRYGIGIFDMYYILYVLIGYELYLMYKNNKLTKIKNIYSLILLILSIIFCSAFSRGNYATIHSIYAAEPYNLYNTVPLLMFSVSLCLLVLNIDIKNEKIINVINYLGHNIYTYYLIHLFIVNYINYDTSLINNFQFLPILLVYLLISLISFVITIIIGNIINTIYKNIIKRGI